MNGTVAFVLKGYPRLSETFIAREIRDLEELGLAIHIYSLRPPRERQTHPFHDAIQAPVAYLPERLRDQPVRVMRALWRQARRPAFARTLKAWLADMHRGPSLDRLRRFGQSLVLADELAPGITHLHAHFLHTPASVTRYASLLTGLPWSCSAHARDIWTSADWDKAQKLKEMAWLVTCTEVGRAHLAALAPAPDKVSLCYHGVDTAHLSDAVPLRPVRDGARAGEAVSLLSVGRAVEKKGFDTLLEAFALLPSELHWRWVHVGDGDRLHDLKVQAAALGLAERIAWPGACTQDVVMAHYRAADLFVLPCRIARDGDRDGLPNVLLEAQAHGLACLTTPVSAIPELIEDGVNGRLVPPDDPHALAEALTALMREPALRQKLGTAGAERVRQRFSHEAGLRILADRFGLGSAAAPNKSAA